jgi:hypothetical protein
VNLVKADWMQTLPLKMSYLPLQVLPQAMDPLQAKDMNA